jgi:hypothetical protein
MRPSGQQVKHPLRVVIVDGLSEHHVVDDDRRVGRENQALSFTPGDRTRLRFGDATHIGVRPFSTMDGFVDVDMHDVELDARGAQ